MLWGERFPAPSLRELSRPTGVTEGVSSVEWEWLNIQSFVGAMKIARQPRILASTPMNGTRPIPAPSLRELARPSGVTEGVSSDGSSVPMVYEPAHIGSEIFERLRATKYTPSVSHSLDSSLREGAGRGAYHSTCRSETGRLRAIFIAPTKTQGILAFSIHRTTLPQSALRAASSLREGAGKLRELVPSNRVLANAGGCGRFSSPLRNSEIITAQKLPVSDAKTIPGGAGHPPYGNWPKA